jgi:hypothetical protein
VILGARAFFLGAASLARAIGFAVGRLQLAVSGYTLPRVLAIVLVLERVLRSVVASAPPPLYTGAIRTSRKTPTLQYSITPRDRIRGRVPSGQNLPHHTGLCITPVKGCLNSESHLDKRNPPIMFIRTYRESFSCNPTQSGSQTPPSKPIIPKPPSYGH